MKLIVVRKVWLAVIICGFVLGCGWYFFQTYSETSPVSNQDEHVFEIHMVTGEFKTTTENGQEIEAYRWDPGTINVPKGEKVKLRIFGVNGKEHPFIIEGTDIAGTVRKGEETIVHLQFEEEGIYRLICTGHASLHDNGPMIGYIVVD